MAVKIVRQLNHIVLIGAPTSAAAHAAGLERAPAALRAAGLAGRLQEAGFQVSDLGDIPPQLFREDEENPRARNVGPVVAALEALKPLIEQAFKSGALPVVLGGDDTIVLAILAGVRRYLRAPGLLYFDSDADLNTPLSTTTGRLDGMVVAHAIGRGAPELVRFWSEPPLVREPDVVLFGLDRLDAPEQAFLARSTMRRYPASEIHRLGAVAAAEEALRRLHAARNDYVLHFDVDIISSEDFTACNFPGSGGVRLEQVRQALEIAAREKTLAALDVSEYNPERDPEGQGAKLLVELLVAALLARRGALAPPKAVAEAASALPQATTELRAEQEQLPMARPIGTPPSEAMGASAVASAAATPVAAPESSNIVPGESPSGAVPEPDQKSEPASTQGGEMSDSATAPHAQASPAGAAETPQQQEESHPAH